jgi:cytochrome d ubiquinol oxidase subunit II
LSWRLLFATLAAIGAVSLATPFLQNGYAERWFAWPNIMLTAQVPLAVAIVSALLMFNLKKRHDYRPFFLTLLLFALSYGGLGISMWPYLVPNTVTIWDAAAPEKSLDFMLVGVAILVPLILAYTSWAYWVFRGKVQAGSGYH